MASQQLLASFTHKLLTGYVLCNMETCYKCNVKFSFFKRRRTCPVCNLVYCSNCMKYRVVGVDKCCVCVVLTQWPLDVGRVASLRARDLRRYIDTHHVPPVVCTEKYELVNLIVNHITKHHQSQTNIGIKSKNQPKQEDSKNDNIPSTSNSFATSYNTKHCTPRNDDTGIRVFSTDQPQHWVRSESYPNILEETREATLGHDTRASSMYNLGPQDLSPSSIGIQQHRTARGGVGGSVDAALGEGGNNAPLYTFGLHGHPHTGQNSLSPAPSPQGSTASGGKEILELKDLKSEDEINNLSIRQCKYLLTLHRVQYRGVVEKIELVDKVLLLWKDYRSNKRDVENLPDEMLCKICMERAIDCVLLECGHLVACTQCGKQMAECPVCRQYVVRVVHTFTT